MKDIIGIQLEVGQLVAFNPPSYKGLTIGRITGFTPQKVRVSYYSEDKTVVSPRDLAVLHGPEVTKFLLKHSVDNQ